jgi:hypothetical protein
MRLSSWAIMAGLLAVVGCGDRGQGGQKQKPDAAGAATQVDSGGMRMGGMSMQGMGMMPQMRAHMDSMMRASPEQMQTMMAGHEAAMSRMLDAMGADMRGMNMAASPEWNALTDSVKEDLAELPHLKGQALSTRVRAHTERVERLTKMHEKMIGNN